MKRTVAIIHYNTPELTKALADSIRLNTKDCELVIFDNSTTKPFPTTEGVRIIDNTKGQIIDFKSMVFSYQHRAKGKYISERHIASVDYLFDILTDGFVLLDSDVLLKQDISDFFDDSVAWAGSVEVQPWKTHTERLAPYILWINVPMCRKHGIRFKHEGMFFQLSHSGIPYYDTGGSFYADCNAAGLPGKELSIYDYIVHFGAGSYGNTEADVNLWLYKHKNLYKTMEEKPKNIKKKVEKPKTDDRILVVIPYCSEGAQGRELEYAVAGWRKHFKENYLIVLAGEDHPITKTGDDIMCIESKRVDPIEGMYRQHLDYVSCFKKVHKAFPDSKGFIFVADDVYAVNDFDMSDVMCLKQQSPDMEQFKYSTANAWGREKIRTRELLKKEGYPIRNFTTHLPLYFEWDKIEALWDKYDMEHNSYTIEDLYYNVYFPTRVPLQLHIDHDNFKCGVYRPNPRIEYIHRAFKTKIWIQNSVEGWIPALDKMLADYYGIK